MLKTALHHARTPILLMGAGTFILLALVGTSSFLAVRNTVLTEEISRSRAIRTAASEELETLLNAETGQRGYLITDDSAYLKPYREARAEVQAILSELQRLTVGRPRLAKRADQLRPIAAAKLEELETTVALHAAGRHEEALEIVRSGQGKSIMDAARTLLQSIRDDAEALVADNIASLNRSAILLRNLTIAGGFLVALFAGLAITLMLRAVRDAVQARQRVEHLNATLEERVQNRTAALTRANDEIQRFAYIVSHDLRAPLVNVMGFTSELEVGMAAVKAYFQDESPAAKPGAVQAATADLPEAVKFIRSSTAKMDRLINAILKLSREGRRELVPEPIDLAKVFEAILNSLKHQIDATQTVVTLPPSMPVIQSDRLAIEQIFSNLIDNALKYLMPGRPGMIVVGVHESRSYVRVTITDNGRGIGEQDLERVFELFRRAGRQDQPGEGIGLASVRALARRLGGDVTVRSKIGEGSEFRVLLSRQIASHHD